MTSIDLNADLGEAETPDGQQAELDVLRYVSSANIACGGHAGNETSMRRTVRAAKKNGVVIGAHPSYPDKDNFGRTSMTLEKDITARELRKALLEQIATLSEIAAEEDTFISYVKPHGALYNDAAENRALADLITDVVAQLDPHLIFMGSPGSDLEAAAKTRALRFIGEGFIDRRYLDNGRLQSRAIHGAVLKDQDARMAQALSLVTTQTATSDTGRPVKVAAHTLCLHGDSAGAVETARQARAAIEAQGISIKAFADGR